MYTKVAAMLPWINDTLNSPSEQPLSGVSGFLNVTQSTDNNSRTVFRVNPDCNIVRLYSFQWSRFTAITIFSLDEMQELNGGFFINEILQGDSC